MANVTPEDNRDPRLPGLAGLSDQDLSSVRQQLLRASGLIDEGETPQAQELLISLGYDPASILALDGKDLEQFISNEVPRIEQSASSRLLTSPEAQRMFGTATTGIPKKNFS